MEGRKREKGTGGSRGAMREIEKEAEEGAKTHGVKAPGGEVKGEVAGRGQVKDQNLKCPSWRRL